MFEKAGADALIPSCGFTSKTPLYMLRGNVPVKEMVRNQKNLLRKSGLWLFGKSMVQEYPYEPLFLLEGAMEIKKAVTIPVIYIGGINTGADVGIILEKGFEFVQVGRALVHDPDFVMKLRDQNFAEPACDQCNRCIAAMDRGGVYCVSRIKGYQ
jgi:2,4-dienoyl-CoA reductase-like NADH-dependent reductase (Old Yellow Enzyme family)